MKINTSLALRQDFELEEEIAVSQFELGANYSLKNIEHLKVKALVKLSGSLFEVTLNVSCLLLLECAYTLELFEQALNFEDTIFFSTHNEDDQGEDVFYEKGPLIELDQYVYGLILAHIPLRVVKPGAKLPSSGAAFEVKTEEDYYIEREKQNTPFADLDLEDFPD